MFSEPLLVLQMDSMKSSIKALTKDKKDYENKYKESQEELAKKEKLLTNCQGRQKLCTTCHNETHIVYWIVYLQTHMKVKHMGICASCLSKNIKTTSNTWNLFTNVSGSATYFSLYFTNLISRQTLTYAL